MASDHPDRPTRLVLVAGTSTEVGKTWVAAHLAARLIADGVRVAARKPAQSFQPGCGPTDAEILAAATGERPDDVCPPHRSYELPMAPFMAADALGRPPFTLADLLGELKWPPGAEFGLVESAGGVRSPITSDGADTVDLARRIFPEIVILVADGGLGTINAVRLCVDALAAHHTVVVLNQHQPDDDVHRRNHDWLRTHLRDTAVFTDVDTLADVVSHLHDR